MKRDLYIILSETSSEGLKQGNSIEGFKAEIYPLIVDDFLGNPEYLSRQKGLKISMYSYNMQNPMADTLWAYEKYATYVIKEIYKSSFGEDIGFVTFLFYDDSTDDFIIGFTLNAADLENYMELCEGSDTYINSAGWSDLITSSESKVIFYEKSEGAYITDNTWSISNSNLPDSIDANSKESMLRSGRAEQMIESDDYFRKYVSEIYL